MALLNCFNRDYTSDQLDRAEGMLWHPCKSSPRFRLANGTWHDLSYDEDRHQVRVTWHASMDEVSIAHLPRIGDGTDKKKGDPYPSHWTVDPFNRRLLKHWFDRDYTAEELDRGDGMRYHPVYFEDPTYMDHATIMSVGYRILLRGVPRDPIHAFYEIEGYDYCPAFRQFVLLVDGCIAQACPRISQKRDVRKGDPYPNHWNYDPFSGADL